METVEAINQRLLEHYGHLEGKPFWKVVWADDQLEKRLCTHTAEGLELQYPQVIEVPKYSGYWRGKYVLEFLTEVPIVNLKDIPSSQLTYEPTYTFNDKNGNPLPPKWEVCEIIIAGVHHMMGYKGVKYKDPYSDPKVAPDVKLAEIKALEEYIFGDETDIGDALAYKSGVGYTTGQIKES